MTVEVDTPQGMRTGSSVIEVRNGQSGGIPNNNFTSSIRGEGVAVDLPGHQTLFALLDNETPMAADRYAIDAYEEVLKRNVGPESAKIGLAEWLPELARQRQSAVLPPYVLLPVSKEHRSSYPWLVRFRDTRDPKTVEAVDPNDLASSFGPGIKLKRIVIQITDDPISRSMKDRLPWLPDYYDKSLDGAKTISSAKMSNVLAAGSFSTEAAK